MSRYFFVGILLLLSLGKTAFAFSITDLKSLSKIRCDSTEESYSFSLRNSKTPTGSDLPVDPLDAKIPGIAADSTMNIRLDGCLGLANVFSLKRIVANLTGSGVFEVFEGPQLTQTTGVSEAVFGNYSKLDLVGVDLKDKSGLLMRASNDGKFAAVIAIQEPSANGKSWKTRAPYFVFGVLEFGDSFDNGPCPFGVMVSTKSFDISSAVFKIISCTTLGGGNTMGFDIVSLEVSDSNLDIPLEFRNKVIRFEGKQLQERLKYEWHHHNDADYFSLKATELGSIYNLVIRQFGVCDGAQSSKMPICPNANVSPSQNGCYYRIDRSAGLGKVLACELDHFAF